MNNPFSLDGTFLLVTSGNNIRVKMGCLRGGEGRTSKRMMMMMLMVTVTMAMMMMMMAMMMIMMMMMMMMMMIQVMQMVVLWSEVLPVVCY